MEISGGIDVCRKLSQTRFYTVVSFLTVGKCDQNNCIPAKNMPVLAGRLVLYFCQTPFLKLDSPKFEHF